MTHQELIDNANIRLCKIGAVMVTEDHPVAASRSGKNTVYHHCEIYQGRPSYASCLMVMDQTFEGVNHLRPDCQIAIEAGTCPALAMRRAELKAGKALFYVDYIELTKRRAIQNELDRESSPIQFRRNRTEKRFVPTQVQVLDADDIKSAPRKQTKPQVETEADDYNTNIMEQVVKKVLNDNNH